MKNAFNAHSRSANSFVATAFGIVATSLLLAGYEVANTDTFGHTQFAQADTIKLAPIVVTAKRLS